MTGRILAACAPLWLLAAGCVEVQRSQLVSPSSEIEPVVARSLNRTTQAPAAEAVAKRVIAVGHKIVLANPGLGLRPLFITGGMPYLEIFHKGTGGLNGCQVIITEGLVNRCTTDEQLAAVLCHELGKVVAEREAAASLDVRQGEEHLPPDVPIGNDTAGTFGPADGTRMMEVAKIEKGRCKPGGKLPIPSADALALEYLKRAGYRADNLEKARPLLREADEHYSLEKGWGNGTATPVGPPAPPVPPPPPPAR